MQANDQDWEAQDWETRRHLELQGILSEYEGNFKARLEAVNTIMTVVIQYKMAMVTFDDLAATVFREINQFK
jgi:hypothetical protein